MAADRVIWCPEMLGALRSMRAAGATYRECADAIGVHEGTVLRKARQLGLNQRMNRGSTRGAAVLSVENSRLC